MEGSRGIPAPAPHLEGTEGTSDDVLGGVRERGGAQGGELVPVAQEAPVVLACVHDEPPEEPAPRLLPQGLLHLPLGHVVADVDQLNQEDVAHAGGDDGRVPHAGEGQRRAGKGNGWVRAAGFSHSESFYTCNTYDRGTLAPSPIILLDNSLPSSKCQ